MKQARSESVLYQQLRCAEKEVAKVRSGGVCFILVATRWHSRADEGPRHAVRDAFCYCFSARTVLAFTETHIVCVELWYRQADGL